MRCSLPLTLATPDGRQIVEMQIDAALRQLRSLRDAHASGPYQPNV